MVIMVGRRSFTPLEERMLIAVTRKMTPCDGCLVTCQWMIGSRISEVLRITVGTVLKGGEVVPKIGLAPRQMKGGYGKTRWVPVDRERHLRQSPIRQTPARPRNHACWRLPSAAVLFRSSGTGPIQANL